MISSEGRPRPELVDDGGHQAQHAARALEALQRGPVLVEPVEELGVDGIGGPHALQVVALGDADGNSPEAVAVHICRRRSTTASRAA
jgi:hypothetical protein